MTDASDRLAELERAAAIKGLPTKSGPDDDWSSLQCLLCGCEYALVKPGFDAIAITGVHMDIKHPEWVKRNRRRSDWPMKDRKKPQTIAEAVADLNEASRNMGREVVRMWRIREIIAWIDRKLSRHD